MRSCVSLNVMTVIITPHSSGCISSCNGCEEIQVIHRDTRDAHRSYPAAVQDHDFSPLMGHHGTSCRPLAIPPRALLGTHRRRPPGGMEPGTGMGQMCRGAVVGPL